MISKPVASTKATNTSDVGTYPIDVTGGSAENYQFSYSTGYLVVNKADHTVLLEQDLSGLKIVDQVELESVSTYGLPINY